MLVRVSAVPHLATVLQLPQLATVTQLQSVPAVLPLVSSSAVAFGLRDSAAGRSLSAPMLAFSFQKEKGWGDKI